MSTKPYQPRRGSVPAQAIDQITQQARPLSTAELAELLGQPQDALAPLLNGARAAGGLINYQRRGHGQVRWWRTPSIPAHDDALPDVDELERTATQASEVAEREPLPIRQLRVPASASSWHPPALSEGKPTGKPHVAGLRVAAWSTGELAIETDDQVIVFNTTEAKAVIALVRALPLAA